jgi:peptidyl-prolyl cis-trans isomerase SurA
MKKYLSFFAAFFLCIALSAQNDPVLMTVNGKNITKSEFEYIYNKNNSNNPLDKKDLNEYVQLFSDLKLKVIEAEAQGLDTTKAFVKEFNGYREQSAKHYLTDNKVEEEVINEAYDRLKEEISVSHILIKIPNKGTPKDTLEAYQKAMKIRKRLKKEAFDKVAMEVSEDPISSRAGGYLGFVTGFQTILPFENAIYSLPVGGISLPVRTQFGYHLIKVNDKRPSQGRILVAHIMKIIRPNTSSDSIRIIKKQIDSIYDKLKAGADFSELARKNSDHIYSAQKGGELPWFESGHSGVGVEFENTAFNLNVGEISSPIRSAYGFHIIKLLDKKPLESLEEKRAELQRKTKYDERGSKGFETFKKELKKEYNFQVIEASIAEIKNVANNCPAKLNDSLFYNKVADLKKPLFSFSDKVFYQNQFIDFLKKSKKLSSKDIDGKLDAFANSKLIEYEDSRLEQKYPEFRMLVQEYHDGMLMFNISSKEVWEKAAEDTTGLRKFFDANKKNYTWETPRFKGTIVYCKDKKTEKRVKRIIASSPKDSIGSYLSKLNTENLISVKIDKGLFVKGENKAVDKYVFKEGDYVPTAEFPIVFVAQGSKILATGPEEYQDMKGLVTSDYQNYLQDEWMKKLRKKYQVIVFQDVLKTVKTN